jgi:uracil-DNA glycosylase
MLPLKKYLTFKGLVKEVRACTLCSAHLPLPAKPVIQLHPNAQILIAGQAPGLKVHNSGIPFDDPSGKRLREWMGIDAEVFYNPEKIAILPMGFCYPGTGKSGDLAPRPECAGQWRNRLLDQLPNIRLTLLIGQYAQYWHLADNRKANLTETVKVWQEYWPAALPLPHPSPRNNRWLKNNPWFTTDVIPVLKQEIKKYL